MNRIPLFILSIFTLLSCSESDSENIANQVGEWEGRIAAESYDSDYELIETLASLDLDMTLNSDGSGFLLLKSNFVKENIEWKLIQNSDGNPSIDIIKFPVSTGGVQSYTENYEIREDTNNSQRWSQFSSNNNGYNAISYVLSKK